MGTFYLLYLIGLGIAIFALLIGSIELGVIATFFLMPLTTEIILDMLGGNKND